MKSGRTTGNWQMGKAVEDGIHIWAKTRWTDYYSRPSTSAGPLMKLSTESFRLFPTDLPKNHPRMLCVYCTLTPTSPKLIELSGILLRLHRQLRRIRMQPANPRLQSPKPHGISRRNCHQMLPSPPKSGEEYSLEREKELPSSKDV